MFLTFGFHKPLLAISIQANFSFKQVLLRKSTKKCYDGLKFPKNYIYGGVFPAISGELQICCSF